MLYFTALYGVTTSHGGQIDVATCACNNAIVRNQEELDRLTQIYFIEELDSIAALCGLNSCNTVVSGDAKSSSFYGRPSKQTTDMKTLS